MCVRERKTAAMCVCVFSLYVCVSVCVSVCQCVCVCVCVCVWSGILNAEEQDTAVRMCAVKPGPASSALKWTDQMQTRLDFV